jgi:ribonuclease HIII
MTDAYGLLEKSLDAWCLLHGAQVVEQKEIPYGRQLVVSNSDNTVTVNTVTVNLYATGKVTVQGKPSALKELVVGWMRNPGVAMGVRLPASTVAPRNNVAAASQNNAAAVPQNNAAAVPRNDAAAVPRNDAAAAPQNNAAVAPRNNAAAASRNDAVAAPQNNAVAAPRNDAAAVPRNDAVAAPRNDAVAAPRNDAVAAPPFGAKKDYSGGHPGGHSGGHKDYSGGHIGIDESGKGDYFGPLVIAAACVAEGDEEWLSVMGVRDCKQLSDAKVLELLPKLKAALPNKIIIINPVRYNALHAKMKNLNILLAWGHARCLEDLVNETGAVRAISDKFSNKGHLDRALMTAGRGVELVQRTKAEDDPAVAAASVLARGEFLNALAEMGKKLGFAFLKGASAPVDAAAKRFVKEFGMERLGEVAKVHFKTTLKISGK